MEGNMFRIKSWKGFIKRSNSKWNRPSKALPELSNNISLIIFSGYISGFLPFLDGGKLKLNQIYDSPPTKYPSSDFALPQPIPRLVKDYSPNVTSALGDVAILNCRIFGIGNKTVRYLSYGNPTVFEAFKMFNIISYSHWSKY